MASYANSKNIQEVQSWASNNLSLRWKSWKCAVISKTWLFQQTQGRNPADAACIHAMLLGKASVAVPSTDSKSTTARLGKPATHGWPVLFEQRIVWLLYLCMDALCMVFEVIYDICKSHICLCVKSWVYIYCAQRDVKVILVSDFCAWDETIHIPGDPGVSGGGKKGRGRTSSAQEMPSKILVALKVR